MGRKYFAKHVMDLESFPDIPDINCGRSVIVGTTNSKAEYIQHYKCSGCPFRNALVLLGGMYTHMHCSQAVEVKDRTITVMVFDNDPGRLKEVEMRAVVPPSKYYCGLDFDRLGNCLRDIHPNPPDYSLTISQSDPTMLFN